MILVTRVLCIILVIVGCGNPRRWPFSVSTKHRTNMRMNAATRCLFRGRHASSRLSCTRLAWRSNGVISGPALLLNASAPPTFTQLASEPKGLLVSDIFAPTDISQHSTNSKLGVTSCGLPWLIYPDPRNASWAI